jgi:hypothetical protein
MGGDVGGAGLRGGGVPSRPLMRLATKPPSQHDERHRQRQSSSRKHVPVAPIHWYATTPRNTIDANRESG